MLLALDFDAVPRDVIHSLFAKLDALTLADVNRVITKRFPSADWVWTVIGPTEKLRAYLAKLGPVTECTLVAPGFGPKR